MTLMIGLKRKTPNRSSQLVRIMETLTAFNKLVWRINETAGVRAVYVAPKSLVYFDLVRLSFPTAEIYTLTITVINAATGDLIVMVVDEPEHQPFLEFLWLEALHNLLPSEIPIIV